jgi:hypothetical protein
MSRPLTFPLDGTVTLVPAADVDATDDVEHFDQRSERAQRAVDAVVFTDHDRVE